MGFTTFSRFYGLLCGRDNPRYANTIAATPAGVRSTYAPSMSPGTSWQIHITSCKNSDGEDTGYTIYGEDLTGFNISTVENATVKFTVDVY